ncbi:hypothetical protein N9D95_00635 [Flavobacteriales bacterium]|nr:hypothetical protein [Flavobacteriales bacterium]
MNRFFTLLFAASCLTAVGQVTYPYNPDGNADGDIAVGDLQDFLVTYGNPFSPSEIMVEDSSLTYWVEQVSDNLDQLNQNLAEGQLTRTRSWPLGQHGRVINHTFQDGEFFVPEDSVLFITYGNSLIVTIGANSVEPTDLNNNNTNHRPLPIPPGATLSAYGLDYWFSGVLISNQENIEILLWDYSDGAYTVPEGKIFIPRWTDGNWGGLITGFFDYDLPSSVVGDRFIELTFAEGTTLVDNNDAGEMMGYLLDKDYFAPAEISSNGVAAPPQEEPIGNLKYFNQSFSFPQGRGGEAVVLFLNEGEAYQVPPGYNYYVYMSKDFGCSNEGIQDYYGGYVDGIKFHTTTPSGFAGNGYASGTTIYQVGCGSYVLYGFLMPTVDWLSHELLILGPGDSITIPEGKHFYARQFVGDNSQLKFSNTPEPPSGLIYSEIDFPYGTGGSHLWSGTLTNNSLGECVIYGYFFDGALYGSHTDSGLGDGEPYHVNFSGSIGDEGNSQNLTEYRQIVFVDGNSHAENGCSGCSYHYTLNLPDCQCQVGGSTRIFNNLGYTNNSPSLRVAYDGEVITNWHGPSFVDFVWTGSAWMIEE